VTAKAAALRELADSRRTATLVAALQSLERTAVDDALDLFDLLMTSRLLSRAERESARDRLRTLPRFTQSFGEVGGRDPGVPRRRRSRRRPVGGPGLG